MGSGHDGSTRPARNITTHGAFSRLLRAQHEHMIDSVGFSDRFPDTPSMSNFLMQTEDDVMP